MPGTPAGGAIPTGYEVPELCDRLQRTGPGSGWDPRGRGFYAVEVPELLPDLLPIPQDLTRTDRSRRSAGGHRGRARPCAIAPTLVPWRWPTLDRAGGPLRLVGPGAGRCSSAADVSGARTGRPLSRANGPGVGAHLW